MAFVRNQWYASRARPRGSGPGGGRGISRALGSPGAQRSTRHSVHRPAGHDHQDGAVVSRAAPS
jgi:hypothetical protein